MSAFNIIECFGRLLLAFITVPLTEKELDIFRETVWNTHRIRAMRDNALPDGIPDHICKFHENYGLKVCGMCHSILCLINESSTFIQEINSSHYTSSAISEVITTGSLLFLAP